MLLPLKQKTKLTGPTGEHVTENSVCTASPQLLRSLAIFTKKHYFPAWGLIWETLHSDFRVTILPILVASLIFPWAFLGLWLCREERQGQFCVILAVPRRPFLVGPCIPGAGLPVSLCFRLSITKLHYSLPRCFTVKLRVLLPTPSAGHPRSFKQSA